MTPKKPDRFERKVEKEYQKWLKGPQVDGWLSIPLTLLRKEHAWVVRIIKKEFRRSTTYYRSPAMVLEEILDQLKRRAQ